MVQSYRIYINEKVLLITQQVKKSHIADFERITQFELLATVRNLLSGKVQSNFVLIFPDVDKIFNYLSRKTKFIEAAGGLVQNDEGKYLFIYRHDKWDLPKGKLEKGESQQEGAKREVEEECNVKVGKMMQPLPSTYHMYELNGKPVLKKTHWFTMHCTDYGAQKPQIEEGITRLEWFARAEFSLVEKNTYSTIWDVLSEPKV